LSGKKAVAATLALLALLAVPRSVSAVPLFAQRYHLVCGTCHNVLPELNAFGNAFRDNGYRIEGLRKRGTTIVALREQVGYERDPAPGTRRFTPAGAILGAAEIGRVEAFLHESLGSQGGPASLFLGYLAYRDAHSGILYRAGLQELPLVHSPAQRNDTLATYGYEGTIVGLNDLTLATPRWGLEAEKTVGATRLAGIVSFANATGSAYGGKPVPTGNTQTFATPEVGLFVRFPIRNGLEIGTNGVRAGIDLLAGSRSISVTGRPAFNDPYQRGGIWLEATRGRLQLLAEQYYGRDLNADGTNDRIDSRGGYARLRWALGSHAFIGVRQDAAANPAATRALLWYAEALVTRHARLLIEQQRPIPGGPTSLEGAVTIGFPWPWGY
jgi:hypothetical protein